MSCNLSLAQTCTPTPPIPTPTPGSTPFNYLACPETAVYEDVDPNDPTPDPPVEAIPAAFQPPDGSQLSWVKYIPAGAGPFPAVLVVHGGGYHGGSAADGGVQKVCRDLRSRGYLALAVNYRLARCGRITGQHRFYQDPLSGRPPQQTDDLKSFVKAARSLSICNQKVGIIGGSAGASHAVFVALDKTASPSNTYPNWCQTEDERPLCAVGLSGGYDFSDREGETPDYVDNVENYTNTNNRLAQKSVSPVAVVTAQNIASFKPLYLINSRNDPMPWHQIEDMRCALDNFDIDEADGLELLTIEGSSAHSFALWNLMIPGTTTRVRTSVLNFLDEHLQ